MLEQNKKRAQALQNLQNAVSRAADFFRTVNANLFDGYETAHEVLAHVVFWQCEHVSVARALVEGRAPVLKEGTFAGLNAVACADCRSKTIEALVDQLLAQQVELDGLLRQLPDWDINYPLKHGGRPCTVEDRVFGLAAHIEHRTRQLRRATYTKRIRSTLN